MRQTEGRTDRADAASGGGNRVRAAVAVAALPATLSILLRLPFLSAPFERDEGEYAYIAWRMALGEVPYLHTFDQKPPGIFGAYWLAFRLFGWGVEAPRVLLALWGALAAVVAALLAKRYGGARAGIATGVAFALLTTAPTFWATAANTELFMLLPLLGALALVFPATGEQATTRPGRLLAAGALIAGAFLFKQIAVFFAFALVPFLLVRRQGDGESTSTPPRLRLDSLALTAAGGLALLLPVVIAFAAAGALGPFLDSVLLHNLRYARSDCQGFSAEYLRLLLARMAASHWPLLALAAGGLVAAIAARRQVWTFMVIWLLAAAASATLGCRFFPHYFLAAAPPLALLAGLAVERLAATVDRRAAPHGSAAGAPSRLTKRAGTLTFALAVALALCVPLARESGLLLATSPGVRSHVIYGPEISPGAQRLGDYIGAHTRPGDAVFVLGSEPQILFHARRRSATRYIFLDPLFGEFPDARERQSEAIAEVQRAHPAAIVFVRHRNSLGALPSDDQPLIRSTRQLLTSEYLLAGALFIVPEGTVVALGAELAALPPGALRHAAALLYLRR